MKDLNLLTQGLRPYAILIALIACLSLPGVFNMPVLDRDEARFTQATAQMLETDDYVVIRFHDELRNKKPVGIHWLQAASVAALSDVEAREIWAWRIPSLLGAMLTACALFWCGTALFNRDAAFAGAVLAGSTLLISSEAHIAKTDAALVGFITLCMAVMAHLRKSDTAKRALLPQPKSNGDKPSLDDDGRRIMRVTAGENMLALLFWFAMGWGFLIKGPIAPMVAGLCVAMLFAWERRLSWLRPLMFWPGPLLAALIVIPWFIASHIATEGAFLREALGVDLGPKMVSGAEGHSAPPGTHLALLPVLFWPATLFLIPGLALAGARIFRRKVGAPPEDMAGWRFVISWALPAWIVFEAAPTKLAHYTMPAYPALALMAGVALAQLMDYKAEKKAPHWPRWLSFVLFCISSLALLAVMSPWGLEALRLEGAGDYKADAARAMDGWTADWRSYSGAIWPFVLAIPAILATGFVFVTRRYKWALGAVVLSSFIVGAGLRGVILPNQDWTLSTKTALELLDKVCGAPDGPQRDAACSAQSPQIVRAIAYAEPSLVFLVGGKIILPPNTTAEIPPRSQDPRPVWLIDLNNDVGRSSLQSIIDQAAADERCVRIEREFVRNYSNGDASELAAVVVEPGLCEPPAPAPISTESTSSTAEDAAG